MTPDVEQASRWLPSDFMAGFVVAYVAGTAVLMLFNIAVLGLGESLWPFGAYFLLWLLAFAPLAIVGLLVLRCLRGTTASGLRTTLLLLAVVLGALEISFLRDAHPLGLLVAYACALVALGLIARHARLGWFAR